MAGKSIFVVCALALSMVGIAFAGSTFTLTGTSMLGTHKLKAGEYEVSIKGDQAVITNPDGKSFSIPVKVEQADKKFDTTSVGTSTANGVDGISEIDLGGSKTKLLFGR
jgi:hypothetical protein